MIRCASSLGALNRPTGSFYQDSRAFHRPTCVRNILVSSWRSMHSWILTTPFKLLSIVHSPSAHSACIHDAFSATMLRRWWTPASISWSHGERHGESATPPAQFPVTPSVCLLSGSELLRSLWVAPNRLKNWRWPLWYMPVPLGHVRYTQMHLWRWGAVGQSYNLRL